jgi:hypothetical protein
VLAKKAQSLEQLQESRRNVRTSLGIFRPKIVHDITIAPDSPEWPSDFLLALRQQRLFERTLLPPRKVPFKFRYAFACNDRHCKGHEMMIEDWELGALFWRLVDSGASQAEAAQLTRRRFLNELCGPDKDTHFYVGTILAHPASWVVVGIFYPKIQAPGRISHRQRAFPWVSTAPGR